MQHSYGRRAIAIAILGVACAISGILAITQSKADTYNVTTEAEAGAIAGNATMLSSQSEASGEASVAFGTSGTPNQGLITRSGTKLMLNGSQYKFAGFNADTIPDGCYWPGEKEATTDENLDKYFSQMNPHSMTRIWPYMGMYDEALMTRVVNAAERHDQYLMATLSVGNEGDSCVPVPDYNDPAPIIAHIDQVVSKFKDSPAIAVWEVCNECNLSPSRTKNWNKAATDEIRKIDPDTLITIGGSTCYTDVIPLTDCISANDLPNNDLISFHEYDKEVPSNWTSEQIKVAQALNKPVFVGETGFTARNSGNCGNQTCNAANMVKELDAYLAMPEVAGVLWWDFKWGSPDDATANLGTPMFTTMANYRHAYQ
jgi:hypothetical protein